MNTRSVSASRAAFMAFACVCTMYVDRAVISNAIVPISVELHLNDASQGWLLSAFAWGYVVGMLPGGFLGVRYRPRTVIGGAAVLWALAMALNATASSFTGLMVSRGLLGLSEAPVFPSLARLIAERVPSTHRTRATALFDSGSYFGPLVGGPTFVLLSEAHGWRGGLQLLAAATFGFALFWLVIMRNTRALVHIDAADVAIAAIWRACIDPRVLLASIGFFSYNFAKSLLFTWLPSIAVVDWGMSQGAAAGIGSLCFGAGIVGLGISSTLTDYFTRASARALRLRAASAAIGLTIGGVLVLVPLTSSTSARVALLAIASAAVISCSGAIWTIPAEIASNAATVPAVGAVQNCIANLANILAPLLVGWARQTAATPEVIMSLFGVISIGGALAFGMLCLGRTRNVL